MTELKWIKLSIDMFNDEKIQLIRNMPEGDALLVIWLQLLTQAGKANSQGYIWISRDIPYTEEMLATIFQRKLQTIRYALQTFEQFGMIEKEGNIISISNWEKHQNIDAQDKIREQNRKRVAEYRARKKALLLDAPENSDEKLCNVTGNVTVTVGNGAEEERRKKKEDTDIDIYKDIYSPIFSKWNDCKIIEHKKMSALMKQRIDKAVKEHSVDEILKAIENYGFIVNSKDYDYSYKWRLEDFISSGLRKFLDESNPLANYKTLNKKKTQRNGHYAEPQSAREQEHYQEPEKTPEEQVEYERRKAELEAKIQREYANR